ncbi:MAG: hypothetical protein HYV53_02910 [Parcubacteria group bacterium]|nr:hypothetical protein [Parcubacteria group bacterium]
MTLFINTTYNDQVLIMLKHGDGSVLASKKFKARFRQSEKLLPAIDKLLKDNQLKLSDLSGLEVENRGGSFTPLEKPFLTGFTALRIGVVTANALAYALAIPLMAAGSKKLKIKSQKFSVVEPLYDREPEITVKKISISVIAASEPQSRSKP